jgi:hypothetical protein
LWGPLVYELGLAIVSHAHRILIHSYRIHRFTSISSSPSSMSARDVRGFRRRCAQDINAQGWRRGWTIKELVEVPSRCHAHDLGPTRMDLFHSSNFLFEKISTANSPTSRPLLKLILRHRRKLPRLLRRKRKQGVGVGVDSFLP